MRCFTHLQNPCANGQERSLNIDIPHYSLPVKCRKKLILRPPKYWQIPIITPSRITEMILMIQRQSQSKSYSLNAQYDQLLNEQAVSLTDILNRPVSCRNILEAAIGLLPTIDRDVLAQKVLDSTNKPRRGRRPIDRKISQ
ncbi:hypothetical protein Xmau_03826 [Xenorhabdus mauleonii]|uniref:Uncharacterized protein n=1 Tax=Xenorhabdus mauleonii TaxID=351675 RepID=A0A1I3V326_9GAMM|nr:hypothetical protein Xmau_03826 [Xenorhabdus mauleonii]SFJ89645.1 hypothetical protein SAMN05421680_11930 [Xenorhabdus mauleonii]